jgi:hypothetical protein
MQPFRILRKLSASLMLGGIIASTLAAPAQAGEPGAYGPARKMAASAACDQARQFAWFQRQLRMREGDTEPLQPAEPAQCGGALAQEGGAAVAQNVAQVERRGDARTGDAAGTVAR